jgi:hypothetical protein
MHLYVYFAQLREYDRIVSIMIFRSPQNHVFILKRAGLLGVHYNLNKRSSP